MTVTEHDDRESPSRLPGQSPDRRIHKHSPQEVTMHYDRQHGCLPVLGNSSRVQNYGSCVTLSAAFSVQCEATVGITVDDISKTYCLTERGPKSC